MAPSLENRIELSIVIPCLNEEEGVGKVVQEAWTGIERTGKRGEVIVVDNGSTDRSVKLAEAAGARVVHEPKRGYGNAYHAGFAEAQGDFIVMGDADGTYDFTNLEPFVAELERGADIVMGSRLQGQIQPGAMPWLHRYVGNPVLTRLINRFFGMGVSDAYCGLRAFRRSALPVLELQATGMEFALEMVLKSAKRGLRMSEVPIEYRPREGDSKLSTLKDGWRSLRFILVHSSTYLFLVPGGALLLLGLAVLLPLAAGPITLFGWRWYIHPMIVASATTLVGAQILQLGLFARTYAVLYLGDKDPLLERVWPKVRLEHGLLLGGVLFLLGAGVLIAIFVEWASGGFGLLAREHEALLGLTLMGLGVQTIFSSFFLSILGLRKQLVFDDRAGRERPVRETAPPVSSRRR